MSFLLAASLGLGLASSIAGGSAKQAQGEYNNLIANFNARVLENDAVRIRKFGNQRENDVRRAGAELQSRQRAAFGARNVEVSSGSAANIQRDTRVLTNVDAMRVRESVDQKVRATKQRASIVRAEGRAGQIAGDRGLISSLLTGGSQFAAGVYGA